MPCKDTSYFENCFTSEAPIPPTYANTILKEVARCSYLANNEEQMKIIDSDPELKDLFQQIKNVGTSLNLSSDEMDDLDARLKNLVLLHNSGKQVKENENMNFPKIFLTCLKESEMPQVRSLVSLDISAFSEMLNDIELNGTPDDKIDFFKKIIDRSFDFPLKLNSNSLLALLVSASLTSDTSNYELTGDDFEATTTIRKIESAGDISIKQINSSLGKSLSLCADFKSLTPTLDYGIGIDLLGLDTSGTFLLSDQSALSISMGLKNVLKFSLNNISKTALDFEIETNLETSKQDKDKFNIELTSISSTVSESGLKSYDTGSNATDDTIALTDMFDISVIDSTDTSFKSIKKYTLKSQNKVYEGDFDIKYGLISGSVKISFSQTVAGTAVTTNSIKIGYIDKSGKEYNFSYTATYDTNIIEIKYETVDGGTTTTPYDIKLEKDTTNLKLTITD